MKKYLFLLVFLVAGQTSFGQGHFIVAWSGNGYDQMNIIVVTANIGGVSLDVNDEIAVFDGTICCGKVTLTQPIVFSDNSTYVQVIASRQEGTDQNGFTVGHPIVFKFWDSSAGVEYTQVTAEFYDSGINLISPVAYTANGTAIVKVAAPSPLKLQAKVLLEGPYNSATGLMSTQLNGSLLPLAQPYQAAPWNYSGTESVAAIPAGVVDWVLVQLRQATSPGSAGASTVLASRAAFLKSSGSITDLDGSSPVDFGQHIIGDGNHVYVVVYHRNHLAVMSSGSATLSGTTFTYDFTNALSKVYGGGTGYKQLASGVFGMVCGDANADGTISATDFSNWAANFGKMQTYLAADFDGDGEVSVLDFTDWAVNFGTDNISLLKEAKLQNTSPFKSQVP